MSVIVIGCGYWGKNLIRNFHELGALEGIVDENKEIASKFSKQYSVKSFSLEEALESKSESVAISVPAMKHHEISLKALQNNKHIFVEKPLSMDLKQADEMINCANKFKKHLMVGHLLQYHPVFIQMKQLINDNFIGELIHINSNRKSLGKIRSEENVIWSFAPHDISMILSIASAGIFSVKTAFSEILQKGICDIAEINIDFEDGLSANISCSWISSVKDHSITVFGKKGFLRFDDTKEWEEKLSYSKYDIDEENISSDLGVYESGFIYTEPKEPLKEECSYFLNLINGKVKSRTDGNEGREVLKVLLETDKYTKFELKNG